MLQQTIANAIAANVRAGRKRLGMTRRQLAAAAGVSERYLSELETGTANASIGILARIAEALQVDFATLLPGGGDSANVRLSALLGRMSSTEQQAALEQLETWLAKHRRSLRGIVLLGLRGAGKTTLGARFAARNGVPFFSITREIETRAGMRLADLFNLGGPDAYRTLENDVVGELTRRRDHIVLETAGGIVGNLEALDLVLGAFKSVWVTASPEEHLARVVGQGDMRPMRDNPKALDHLKALLAARAAGYARAEHVLDTSGRSVDACLADLQRIAAPLLT